MRDTLVYVSRVTFAGGIVGGMIEAFMFQAGTPTSGQVMVAILLLTSIAATLLAEQK